MENNELEIQKAWDALANKKFNNDFKKETIMNAIKIESDSTISKLKKGLKIKLFWSIGIGLAILGFLLYNLGNPDMVKLLGFAVTVYALGSLAMFVVYRKINLNISGTNNLLSTMKYNAGQINKVLKVEMVWGILTFIPAIVVGMLISNVGKGYTIAESFSDAGFLKVMIGAVVILVPLMYWMTNKMNKAAFGKNLKVLEENIVKMETLS